MSSVLYPEFWLPGFMKLTNLPVRTFNDYQNLMTWLLTGNDNQILWNMKAPLLVPPSLSVLWIQQHQSWSVKSILSQVPFHFKCPIKGMEVRGHSHTGLFSISLISKGQAWKSCRNAFKTTEAGWGIQWYNATVNSKHEGRQRFRKHYSNEKVIIKYFKEGMK